jgi:hypothetical protein
MFLYFAKVAVGEMISGRTKMQTAGSVTTTLVSRNKVQNMFHQA